MGATGAVGSQALECLLKMKSITRITLLGRREKAELNNEKVQQRIVDVFDVSSYADFITDENIAICTFGIGEPSKVSKEEFIKTDKEAVLNFAKECKKKGVEHFEILASVGINSKSSSFYLRVKGELVDELEKLNFNRLSVFQPSMILTPTNRYGFSQALTLAVWPYLNPLLSFGLKKYRGIKVELLGKAMALNILEEKTGTEYLTWSDFQAFKNESPM
jgi:uncharacterized protein YbjT (DUF2867 family)